jgi:ComF family protein
MLFKVNNRRIFSRLQSETVCILCRAGDADGLLCSNCVADLPRLGPACRQCAAPLPRAGICRHCQRQPPPFQSCVATYRYEFPLDELIKRMKFNGQPGLAQALARLMLPAFMACDLPPSALLPMPLHWRRSLARGYNQALELARPLAAFLGWPLLDGLCRRVRHTRPQSELSGRARQDNVREAFALTGRVPDRIVIVDDVFT